jgi:RsiW-degrading membrane proteinase PrsW (M82 family)
MPSLDPTLAVLAAAAATGWAALGAARAPGPRRELVLRGLLGGGAAFGLALLAYDLLGAAGLGPRWEQLMAGSWTALSAALVIGLVEEGAKLGGIFLSVRRAEQPGAVMATTVGVCAAFAGLETATALSGAPFGPALGRALLAPVAHAVLSAPLGFAVALATRRGWRTGLVAVSAAVALAALLHALGDLALAAPRFGRLGYATALLAPVLAIYLHARRLLAVPARTRASRAGQGALRR